MKIVPVRLRNRQQFPVMILTKHFQLPSVALPMTYRSQGVFDQYQFPVVNHAEQYRDNITRKQSQIPMTFLNQRSTNIQRDRGVAASVAAR
jgi:hypothetical protein